jgi:CTP:molybdopterin cytidylyltransferase MocA/SAM-dependent methyltransferase
MGEHRRMRRARTTPPPIAAVVLAAGAGSRFGGKKLLAPLEGRPILQHVLDRLEAAGLDDVVVVVGDDAGELEAGIDWGAAQRVVNPAPDEGLSSSLKVGIGAVPDEADGALITLGDQPLLPARAIRALIDAEPHDDRPIVVPVYGDGAGRNPVLLRRPAFDLVDEASGDRGLGPLLASHPELVEEIPIRVEGGNPDVDTREDLVGLLEKAWAARVVANAEQVERFREVPDGPDFYAPVTGLFRADPRRTDEPVLDALLRLVRTGETWLDIGAGAGRYALPIALALAPSGGRVIALDASPGMLDALMELQTEHGVADVEVIETRWPPADGRSLERFAADVALIAHVGYDIEAIGPFVRSMEAVARRLCVAVLMERQPSSVADACWPPVHGEERVPLPALPEFVELLRARGHQPTVEMVSREPRRFGSREELAGFLRRQLWIEPRGAGERRFQEALDELIVVDDEGGVGLRTQEPLPIGVVTWDPRGAAI